MTNKRFSFLLSALMLCFLLTGCSVVEKVKNLSEKESTAVIDEGGYQIYYRNPDGNDLVTRTFVPESRNFDGILTELLEQFKSSPDAEAVSTIPSNVEINGCTMGVDNLTVDFNSAYLEMNNVEEILLRAGLVKTLIQMPGVLSASVTVDGQPLKEPDDTAVGSMNENTFIDSNSDSINSQKMVELELYFASEDGQGLLQEHRNIGYSSNLIMERVITEEIIKGPAERDSFPVVNPDVKVNSVEILDDVCVIDFDNTFNTVFNQRLEPEVCLYAFVNALCESCPVKGVRFQVNEEVDKRFLGQINLDQVFEPDMSLVRE